MARADIETLLPLDHYAQLMAMHPDAFNQCTIPDKPYASDCRLWLQHGWYDQPGGQISGRHDIAQAIATAELKIQEALQYAPAPKYFEGEIHNWPRPKRGVQILYPPIMTNWGYLIKGGQRAMTIIDEDAAIVYSDADGDGVLDTATISITAAQMTAASASRAEVQVFWADETDDIWRIKHLDVIEDAVGNITITGRRSQFVDPDRWLTNDALSLGTNANFVTVVDVYRVYTDNQEAQLQWKDAHGYICSCGCASTDVATCSQTCQESCLIIFNERLGEVKVKPAAESGGSWTASNFSIARYPDRVRIWYNAGWPLIVNSKRYQIRPDIAEAIARLANVYMVAPPCGCEQTRRRWSRDRERMDINSADAALAMSAFGEVTRGSMWAWHVVKLLRPLGQAGSLGNRNW